MIRRFITSVILVTISLGAFPSTGVHAANDQFTISQGVIVADGVAPSTPLNLVATPTSIDQINLSWDASTDNVGVSGYQVFRDNVQIATSAGTSYSDIGLLEATSYDYNVTAFDAALNISARSATTSATTLTTPSTSTPLSGNIGIGVPIEIYDLVVIPETYAVTVRWKTNQLTRATLLWGLTNEHELGSLSERTYTTIHATRITGLVPGTTYSFRIDAEDRGERVASLRDSFRTLVLKDTEAPANVSGLFARAEGEDVRLTWQNPRDPDFAFVRIIRRTDGYPTDPHDGLLIYEGSQNGFLDKEVLKENDRAFYALFAYDDSGNTSSGAIAVAYKAGVLRPPLPTEPEVIEGVEPIQFSDLIFLQNGKEVPFIGDEVTVNGQYELEIRLPYERLPEHLKTILVTFEDKEGRWFQFLLRVNKEKTYYGARIAPFGEHTTFTLMLHVFDYAERTLSAAKGTLVSELQAPYVEEPRGVGALIARLTSDWNPWFWALMLFLLLVLSYIYTDARLRKEARGRRYDEDEAYIAHEHA